MKLKVRHYIHLDALGILFRQRKNRPTLIHWLPSRHSHQIRSGLQKRSDKLIWYKIIKLKLFFYRINKKFCTDKSSTMKKIIFVSTGIVLMIFILAFQNEVLALAIRRLFCEIRNNVENGIINVYQGIKSFVG